MLSPSMEGACLVAAWDRVELQGPGIPAFGMVWRRRPDPRAVLCPVTCTTRTEEKDDPALQPMSPWVADS